MIKEPVMVAVVDTIWHQRDRYVRVIDANETFAVTKGCGPDGTISDAARRSRIRLDHHGRLPGYRYHGKVGT